MDLKPFYNIDLSVDYLMINSKDYLPNSLFICLNGSINDGHQFISEAITNGAIAILSEKNINVPVPVIIVQNTKKELGRLANAFYNYPSKKMTLIGITGTDGKTSTATIIKNLLSNCGYIGTNGIDYNEVHFSSSNTTPNNLELNSILHDMQISNIKHVAMEVSSHALSQGRVEGIEFEIVIFTNLTHEHLDYYHSMDNYFKAKAQLFFQSTSRLAIINNDDAYGQLLKTMAKSRIITYGIKNSADYQAVNIRYNQNGTTFDLIAKKKYYRNLETNLIGEFNCYNLLASITSLLELHYPIRLIRRRIYSLPQIDGRLQFIENKTARIVIDFAHTPNALLNALKTVKHFNTGNLILVMGATGNRDKTKRRPMGKIASELADFVIFTEEDNYSEDVDDIINELISGITKENYLVITNRKEAIKYAIKIASPVDTILITGKGNEKTMKKSKSTLIYNDIDEVRKYV